MDFTFSPKRIPFAQLSGCRKRGVEFKGGSLHAGGLDGFGGPGEHLALLLRVLQNTVLRGDRDGSDGFQNHYTHEIIIFE